MSNHVLSFLTWGFVIGRAGKSNFARIFTKLFRWSWEKLRFTFFLLFIFQKSHIPRIWRSPLDVTDNLGLVATTLPFAKSHLITGVGVPKAKQGMLMLNNTSTDATPGNLIIDGFALKEYKKNILNI